ncbi:formate/nitrite transporter family protein [Pseudomonas sp. Marseille-QA0892]
MVDRSKDERREADDADRRAQRDSEFVERELDPADELTEGEKDQAVSGQPPRPQVLHEIIRLQGRHELERSAGALFWSALAAGLSIGLSMMALGLLSAYTGESEMAPIIYSFGYPVGFLAIILARQQLFTENTLTAVLPVMSDPSVSMAIKLLRLWAVVLVGNMVGAMIFAYGALTLPIFSEQADEAFLTIGREVMHNDAYAMFAKAIVSGWMIATMVWLIPAAEGAKIWIIIIITYCMALGSFAHIVVGTAEVSYLVFAGELGWSQFWWPFALPTLAGNIVGGSLIFAIISHAQIRSEVP